MKRASHSDEEVGKKIRGCTNAAVPGTKEETDLALKQFAKAKAEKREASEGELQHLRLLLRRRSLLKQFDAHIASVMPEIYCVLSELLKKPPKMNSPSAKLAFLIVSTWVMAVFKVSQSR